MSEPDVLICDILATGMSLDPDRVVVYASNFDAPKDPNIFIVVSAGPSQIVGIKNDFDPDTNEEVQAIVVHEMYTVEITSKNRDAQTRRLEAPLALDSTYARRVAEDNGIGIFPQSREMQDLSFVDGASALHRYRFPVIISRVKEKRTVITPIASFPSTEVIDEPA